MTPVHPSRDLPQPPPIDLWGPPPAWDPSYYSALRPYQPRPAAADPGGNGETTSPQVCIRINGHLFRRDGCFKLRVFPIEYCFFLADLWILAVSLIWQKHNANDLTLRAMTKAFIHMKRAVSESRPSTSVDSTVGNILGVTVRGEDVPAICDIEKKSDIYTILSYTFVFCLGHFSLRLWWKRRQFRCVQCPGTGTLKWSCGTIL